MVRLKSRRYDIPSPIGFTIGVLSGFFTDPIDDVIKKNVKNNMVTTDKEKKDNEKEGRGSYEK